MGNPIAARKNGNFKAVSTAPSFNKTPVGNSTPPLPYGTTQDLGNSVSVVPTVKLNGDPAYVLNQTTQPSCKGDNPGVAKGVKSGTVNGKVTPTKASTTVRMGGKPIVRQGDPCTMNGGNNPGVYITTQTPSATPPKHAAGNADPRTKPQTPPEKSFLDKAMDAARSAGQTYKDKVSESLHDFAGSAMDKGGTIAAAGSATAAVGGAMVATGIGAAPGAVMVAGGGATAAVGGGVSAVGGIAETAATGLDAAADFATSGKLPNVVGMATAYAERMVMSKLDKLTKLIPGKGKKSSKPQAKKETEKEKSQAKAAEPKPAGNGTTIVGKEREEGRCKLRKYKEGCPSGTPHHVVPDHCFKQPGGNGTYYPGAIQHADGLCICVEGATKSTGANGKSVKKGKMLRTAHFNALAQHGQIHILMDAAELALGAASTPKGTASLGQLEKIGAAAAAKVTGCDAKDLEAQLRNYHQSKGLGTDAKLRADPFGKIKDLDPTKMGKPLQTGGPSGRE